MIQLKIEREAMKKETDDASRQRLNAIEKEIEELSRKYSDLEEIWKAEKSQALGEKDVRDEIDRVRREMEACRREARYERLAELQYAVLPKLEEKLKKADEVAYVRFASVYRQFKDINTFMSELNKLLSEK